MAGVCPEELESLLVRGWRRLGPFYFRPACAVLNRALRIPARRSRPGAVRSGARRARHRRIGARGGSGAPDLYAAGSARESGAAGAPADGGGLRAPVHHPHEAGAARGTADLVGVSPVRDPAPGAQSLLLARHRPPPAGVANVMLCLALARQRGIPYVYLGYRVLGCPSMCCKATFRLTTPRRGGREEGSALGRGKPDFVNSVKKRHFLGDSTPPPSGQPNECGPWRELQDLSMKKRSQPRGRDRGRGRVPRRPG
jgi:arginine-tRNA-protein transferase